MLKIYVKYLSKSIGPFFFRRELLYFFGFSWFFIGRPPKAPVDISLSETGVQRHENEMNETNETEHPNCSLDPNRGELCLTTTLGCFFESKSLEKKELKLCTYTDDWQLCDSLFGGRSFEGKRFFLWSSTCFRFCGCGIVNTYGCVDSLKLSMEETKTTWLSKDIALMMEVSCRSLHETHSRQIKQPFWMRMILVNFAVITTVSTVTASSEVLHPGRLWNLMVLHS